MDALVEETVNASRSSPLSQSETRIRSNGTVVFAPSVSRAGGTTVGGHSSTVSIVQVALPNNVQSVIQPGPGQQSQQPSVIQAPLSTAATLQPVQLQFEESLFHDSPLQNKLGKNVILLNKVGSGAGSTVIHSTEADPRVHPVQLIQAKGDNGDIIVGGDSDTKKRREILARRPSYRKILNDLSEPGLTAELKEDTTSNEASSQESDSGAIIVGGQYHGGLLKVVPALQLGSQDGTIQSLTGGGGGTLVQYAQSQEGGQQFFVPVTVAELSGCQIRTAGGGGNSATSSPLLTSPGGGSAIPEETSRKREIRLLKNREAAKECRRKKKEYIKCLENRVAVLENQNKALIDELKSLKELYCRKE